MRWTEVDIKLRLWLCYSYLTLLLPNCRDIANGDAQQPFFFGDNLSSKTPNPNPNSVSSVQPSLQLLPSLN